MKKTLLLLIILAGFFTSADAQVKIGYTNIELLLAYMPSKSEIGGKDKNGNLLSAISEVSKKDSKKRLLVLKAIASIAKENGYAAVVNEAKKGKPSNILYGTKAEDVTQLVARKLGIRVPRSR